MTDIPKEIMEEAHRVAHKALTVGVASDRGVYLCVSRDAIARALMARDKRAAEIAREEGVSPELNISGGGPDWYKHGQRISRAILTYEDNG